MKRVSYILFLLALIVTNPTFSQSGRAWEKGATASVVAETMMKYSMKNISNMQMCNKSGETSAHNYISLLPEFEVIHGPCFVYFKYKFAEVAPPVGILEKCVGSCYLGCYYIYADELEYRWPVDTLSSSTQIGDDPERIKFTKGGFTLNLSPPASPPSGGLNLSALSMSISGDSASGLMVDLTKNDLWNKGAVDRTKANIAQTLELANLGLKELKQPQLQITELDQQGLSMAQQRLNEWLEKPVAERYNTTSNLSAWGRTTFEPINLNSPKMFDGTCHVPFQDVLNTDYGEQYKYFSSPLVSLTRSLMDLPNLQLEQMRKTYCKGTACANVGGMTLASAPDPAALQNDGAAIFRCFKNNKALGRSVPNLLAKARERNNNFAGDLSFLGEIFPTLNGAREGNPRLCIDFTGNRFPWAAVNAKFFSSYRHIGAWQQALDASQYFQYLSSFQGQTAASDPGAKLPIGHTINDFDRFYAQAGNVALELAADPAACPHVEDMSKMPFDYKQANMVDMKTSEYQALTRYVVFKCGGGKDFRGATLEGDASQALCQSDPNAKPYDGASPPFPFWDKEYANPKLIPKGQTRVC